ncbi:unnamed protein product [Pylaiella littoralis]
MVKIKMCSSEAIQQCADAVEVFRSSSWACGGANTHNIATNPMAKKPSPGDGTTSTSGLSRKGGTRHPEEELKSLRFRLEAETIQLAVASFGTEVRQLAISPSAPAHSMVTEATIIGQEPPPPALTPSSSLSSLPSDYFSQRDPTRSWLDLRRAARVRAFAQALGEMMSPGREALLDDDLMAGGIIEKQYNHNVSVLVSSHDRKIGDLQTRSRTEAEEAIEATLEQVRNLATERSSELKVAAEIRRRTIESAVGWVDTAIKANLRRWERRRCRHRERVQQFSGDPTKTLIK